MPDTSPKPRRPHGGGGDENVAGDGGKSSPQESIQEKREKGGKCEHSRK